jgi:hypothetical protein
LRDRSIAGSTDGEALMSARVATVRTGSASAQIAVFLVIVFGMAPPRTEMVLLVIAVDPLVVLCDT